MILQLMRNDACNFVLQPRLILAVLQSWSVHKMDTTLCYLQQDSRHELALRARVIALAVSPTCKAFVAVTSSLRRADPLPHALPADQLMRTGNTGWSKIC